jgi:hypothetical protein
LSEDAPRRWFSPGAAGIIRPTLNELRALKGAVAPHKSWAQRSFHRRKEKEAMAKTKTHPADLAERALIRDAIGFTASIFIGVGQFEKANAATLIEARQHAAAFSERIKNGRKPMIYAGLADGRQIFVPDDYQPTEQTMTTATETKSITAPAPVKPTKKKTTVKKKSAKKASAKKASTKKAPRNNGAAKSERPLGQRAAMLAAAEAGKLPPVPDFSAPTHERFRKKLAEVVALVKASDVRKLKAFEINPVSSSPKAIDRYRNVAVIALSAKAAS